MSEIMTESNKEPKSLEDLINSNEKYEKIKHASLLHESVYSITANFEANRILEKILNSKHFELIGPFLDKLHEYTEAYHSTRPLEYDPGSYSDNQTYDISLLEIFAKNANAKEFDEGLKIILTHPISKVWYNAPYDSDRINIIERFIETQSLESCLQLIQHPQFEPGNKQLSYLAAKYKPELIPYLIKMNVIDINEIGPDNETPLLRSIKMQDRETIRLLLQDKRLDVNKAPYLQTPLHQALQSNQRELAKELIMMGADVHKDNIVKYDAFDSTDDLEILNLMKQKELLVNSKASPDLKEIYDHPFFSERLDKLKKTKMSLSVFAHINNDHKIQGTWLDGNTFAHSVETFGEMLGAVKDSVPGLDPFVENMEKDFQQMCRLNKNVDQIIQQAMQNKTNQKYQEIHDKRQMGFETKKAYYLAKDKKNQKECIDKLVAAVITELNEKNPISILAGWSKHAIICELKKEGNDLFLTINNTGAGIEFHPKKQVGRKEKMSSTMVIKIPNGNNDQDIKGILENIMRLNTDGMINENVVNANTFYPRLIEGLPSKSVVLPPDEKTVYITGQRGGTCTWRVIATFLKKKLPKKLYKDMKYQIKLQSLLELYTSEASKNNLGNKEVQEQLKDALSDFSRSIKKKIESGQSPNEFKEAVWLIETIEKNLARHVLDIPDRKTTTEDMITAKSNISLPDIQAKEGLIDQIINHREKYDYLQSFDYKNSKDDFLSLLKRIRELKNEPHSEINLCQMIEQFFIKLPMVDSYWKKEGDKPNEDYEASAYLLGNIQQEYAEALSKRKDKGVIRHNQLLACYSMAGACAQIDKNLIGAVAQPILSSREELEKEIFADSSFYSLNSEHEGRLKELRNLFEVQLQKDQHRVMYRIFDSEEQDKLWSYYESIENNLNDLPREIKDRMSSQLYQQYIITRGLTRYPELVPEEYQRRYSQFHLHIALMNNIRHLSKGLTDTISNNSEFNANHFLKNCIETRYQDPTFLQTASKVISTQINDTDNHHYVDDIHPNTDTNSLRIVFKLDAFVKVEGGYLGNELQLSKILDQLPKEDAAILRDVLHTRTDSHSIIAGTINFFMSNIGKLSNISYQSLLTATLFYPEQLAIEVKREPSLIFSIITLLEKIESYHAQENTITNGSCYVMKLVQLLLSHQPTYEQYLSDSEIKEFHSRMGVIQNKIKEYISINDPDKRLFGTNHEKRNAIHLQCKLYLSLLQKYNRDALSRPPDTNELEDILKASYYISMNLYDHPEKNEKIDPILIETRDALLYRIGPKLKQYFDSLPKEKHEIYIVSLFPKENQSMVSEYFKNAKTVKYEYPNFIFETDMGEITLNLQSGNIRQSGSTIQLIPNWLIHNSNFQKWMGHMKIEMARVSSDKEWAEIDVNGHKYRFYTNGEIYKEIAIYERDSKERADKVTSKGWYRYINLDRENQTHYSSQLSSLPKYLNDLNHQAWVSDGKKEKPSIVYSSINTGQNQYVVNDGSILSLGPNSMKDGYEVVNLYQYKKPNDFDRGEFERLLQFEDPGFIEIMKLKVDKGMDNLSPMKIRFPRYNLEFIAEHIPKPDGPMQFVWTQDKSFRLDISTKKNPINSFENYLRLVPTDPNSKQSDLLLMPFVPMLTVNKKKVASDIRGLYLEDQRQLSSGRTEIFEEGCDTFNPNAWFLHKSAHYVRCSIPKTTKKDDRTKSSETDLKTETAEDSLYMAYIYLSQHDYKSALKMLARMRSQGGLSGSRKELLLLSFILKEIPYQLKTSSILSSETAVAKNQSDAIIDSPELCAFKLSLLSDVHQFLSLNGRFTIDNDGAYNQNNLNLVNESRTLKELFEPESIRSLTLSLLKKYRGIENNVPIDFRLDPLSHESLYRSLPEEILPESEKVMYTQLKELRQRMDSAAFKSEVPKTTSNPLEIKASKEVEMRNITHVSSTISLSIPKDFKFHLTFIEYKAKSPEPETFDDYSYYLDPVNFEKNYYPILYQLSERYFNKEQMHFMKEMLLRKIKSSIQMHSFKTIGEVNELLRSNEEFKKMFVLYRIIENWSESYDIKSWVRKIVAKTKWNEGEVNFDTLTSLLCSFDQTNPFNMEVLLKKVEGAYQIEIENLPSPHWQDPEPISHRILENISEENILDTVLVNAGLPIDLGYSQIPETEIKAIFEGIDTEDYQAGLKINRLEQNFRDKFIQSSSGKITNLKIEVERYLTNYQKSLEKLDEQLLLLANELPADLEKQLLQKLNLYGEHTRKITKQDLIDLFLKGDLRVFEHQGIQNEKALKLYQLTAEALALEVQVQQLKRCKDAISDCEARQQKLNEYQIKGLTPPLAEKDEYQKSLAKLGAHLYARRCYKIAENPNFLPFEVHGNILIREAQKDMLSIFLQPEKDPKTGGYKNKVGQLIMGGGKSKVLMPICAYMKANGDNLPIFIVPPALRKTNFKDLSALSWQLFKQPAFEFYFDRDCGQTVDQLIKMRDGLKMAILKKGYLVTTAKDVQSLELKWLELLHLLNEVSIDDPKYISISQRITIMEEMLELFKNKGDVYIDEIDSVLDVRKELNYTIGKEIPMEDQNIDIISEFYSEINDVSFNIQNKKFTVLDAMLGKLPSMMDKEWDSLFDKEIKENIIIKLINSETSPLRKILEKHLLHRDHILEFIRGLKTNEDWFDSLSEKDQDVICLYKQELTTLLQLTLRKVPNVHYGYSKKAFSTEKMLEKYIAIPYSGSNAPSENSKFESQFETANYTIQLTYLEGVSKVHIKKILEDLRNQAISQRKLSENTIPIAQTEAGRLYTQLFGPAMSDKYPLFQLNPESTELVDIFHADYSKNKSIIKHCLQNYILKQIKTGRQLLKHNGQDHIGEYRSMQGGSGTIESGFVFDKDFLTDNPDIVFDPTPSKGTDGRIQNYLIGKETVVRTVEENIYQTIAQRLSVDSNIRALIDVGAHFRGITNIEVAKQLANTLKTQNSNIRYVLFYNEHDQLSALSVTSPAEPILIGSSDVEVVRARLGCDPQDLFTYYDEQRTTGTDIKQMPNAKGLCVFSRKMNADSPRT